MKSQLIFCLLAFVVGSACAQSCSNSSFNSIIWYNLTDFIRGGWIPSFPDYYGPGVSFNLPSNISPNLAPLDADSSNGVWSGNTDATRFEFLLPIKNRTDLQGMTEATITIKYYATNTSSFNFYPCLDGEYSLNCRVPTNSTNHTVEWKYETLRVDTSLLEDSPARFLSLYASNLISLAGPVILDYVSLTHNGGRGNCSDSCNDTCEYVAIDCHNYYSCVNSRKEYFTCNRTHGLAFNPQLRVCDFMHNVAGCGSNCGCEYRPHPNCSSYYFCRDACIDKTCEVRRCPQGLVWSRDWRGHQQCNLPQYSNISNCTLSGTYFRNANGIFDDVDNDVILTDLQP